MGPNQEQQKTATKEKIKTPKTTKQNKNLVLIQKKTTQPKGNTTKTIQRNIIPNNEPIPDTTKMNTAQIIQNTYVEYLPDGTKRDRYRKEFLKKLQLTNNETTKRKREEQETETTKQKTKVEPQQDNSQLNTQATQQETTYIENERNQRYAKLPQTKIEQIREEENLTTKPNTTKQYTQVTENME